MMLPILPGIAMQRWHNLSDWDRAASGMGELPGKHLPPPWGSTLSRNIIFAARRGAALAELCTGLHLGSRWEGRLGRCQRAVSPCPGWERGALAEGCGRTGRAGLQQKVRAKVWVWHPARGLGSVVGQFFEGACGSVWENWYGRKPCLSQTGKEREGLLPVPPSLCQPRRWASQCPGLGTLSGGPSCSCPTPTPVPVYPSRD